jgi:hypothetical protein
MDHPASQSKTQSLPPPTDSWRQNAAVRVPIVSNEIIYPTIPSWNGRVLACYRRNSTTRQRDNARAYFQLHDLANYCLSLGFAVRLFDEQATSGARLSKRTEMNNILAAIRVGTIHGIAVADISRLTRDKYGVDPDYIGQLLVRYAEGRLVVYGRPMDLRRQEDWAEYERITRIAIWERDDTMERLFDGLKITAERAQNGELDVFVRTHVKFGYKRVYLSDTDGRPLVGANNKVRSTVERDVNCANGMAILEREFDCQPTLAAVVRALHRAGIQGRWKSARGTGTWSGEALRAILRDPLYVGEWRFAWTDHVSAKVWQRFASSGFDPRDVKRDVPHLAWFDRADWERWRAKFLSQRSTSRVPRHRHRLLGIVLCNWCGRPLVSGASEHGYSVMYRCRQRYRKVDGCDGPIMSEVKMLAAMQAILPDVLNEATDVVGTVSASLSTEVRQLEERLAVVQERKQFLEERFVRGIPVQLPQWLRAESQELDIAEALMRKALHAMRTEYNLSLNAAENLRNSGVEAFAALESGPQATVWKALLSEVRFGVSGRTFGRKVWVESWTLAARARACTPDMADTARSAAAADAFQDSMGQHG